MSMFILTLFAISTAVFLPFVTIWSINTLFGLAIAYTFKTWLASLVLGFLVGGRKTSKK
jgi:hypothetical protein